MRYHVHVIVWIISAILFILFFAGLDKTPASAEQSESMRVRSIEYTQTCEVVSIDDLTVYVTRPDGEEFAFIGDGFKVGQTVTARFNNNGTPTYCIDDSVIDAY